MITIASDTHLRTSTMSVLDDNGIKLIRSKLDNNPDEILEFVQQFPRPRQFALGDLL